MNTESPAADAIIKKLLGNELMVPVDEHDDWTSEVSDVTQDDMRAFICACPGDLQPGVSVMGGRWVSGHSLDDGRGVIVLQEAISRYVGYAVVSADEFESVRAEFHSYYGGDIARTECLLKAYRAFGERALAHYDVTNTSELLNAFSDAPQYREFMQSSFEEFADEIAGYHDWLIGESYASATGGRGCAVRFDIDSEVLREYYDEYNTCDDENDE